MSKSRPQREADTPAPAQTTPPQIGQGHPEYHFVQSVMELQRSIGRLEGSLEQLHKSSEKIESKVDVLTEWRHKMLGAAAVLGIVVSILTTVLLKAFDYYTAQPATKPPVGHCASESAVSPSPSHPSTLVG
jgi:hypothetical protein